jgi:hypothetical protein
MKLPPGYYLHILYLSSLELKCIMPNDLKECNDIEGLYKIQKNTLQIGDQDYLQKGDILYIVNGQQMNFKNKFEMIDKLGSMNGVAEVAVLRKNNNFSSSNSSNNKDRIPYHNGIFAQNSIKLAMRKYETPPDIKSNSDSEFNHFVDVSADKKILISCINDNNVTEDIHITSNNNSLNNIQHSEFQIIDFKPKSFALHSPPLKNNNEHKCDQISNSKFIYFY